MAGLDFYGDFINVDVPKKAIQAQNLIYQASTLMSVAKTAGIPTIEVNNMLYKEDATRGREGEYDVAVDAHWDHTKLIYKQMKTELKWSIYAYLISESAKLISRDPKRLWTDSVTSAAEYFAAVRDYVILTALGGGDASTAAAAANWDAANADIETDIITALQSIVANSNIQHGEKISVVMPADVSYEVKKLTLIMNIQRTMQDYLEKSFSMEFLTYRPMLNSAGSAMLDGLEDDCLVFVQGAKTAKGLEFSRAEAARRGLILVEHSRVHGRGDAYTQKMATGAIVTWDGVQTYSESTPLTARIYEITDVT